MAQPARRQFSKLITQLLADGSRFEFFQALRLLTATTPYTLQLKPALQREFPASDIKKITQDSQGITLTLTFMGLYGVDSPLLHYFTDIAARDDASGLLLRYFLDIFNQRFYQLYYNAWKKNHSYVQLENGKNYYLRCLQAISGNVLRDEDSDEFAYAGLLGAKVKSANNLKAMLAEYLQTEVSIASFVPRWITISNHPKLGEHYCLGDNATLGNRVLDLSSKISITIGPLLYQAAKTLLPQQHKGKKLARLIRRFLGPTIVFDTVLIIVAETTEPQRLGFDEMPLGWCAWLGIPQQRVYGIRIRYSEKLKKK